MSTVPTRTAKGSALTGAEFDRGITRGGAFETVAELLASTLTIWATSDIISAQGFRYKVVTTGQDLTTAGSVKLKVQRDGDGYNVLAFGADRTGAASSVTAFTKAIEAANADAVSHNSAPDTGDTLTAAGAVIVPPGKYLISSTISVSNIKDLSIICPQEAIIMGSGTKANGFISGTNFGRKFHCEGLVFRNFNTVFAISTANMDISMWNFERCGSDYVNLFCDTNSYTTVRSTLIHFYRCTWKYRTLQVIKSYADMCMFDRCWFGAAPGYMTAPAAVYGNSYFVLRDCIYVAIGSAVTGKSWVYLTKDNGAGSTTTDVHRGVVISGGRMSNEGASPPLVVVDYSVSGTYSSDYTSHPHVVVENMTANCTHGSTYESGGEAGIVHLITWPGSVTLRGMSFWTGGASNKRLVSAALALSGDPSILGFTIDIDETSWRNYLHAARAISTGYPVTSKLRGWVRNPDPFTFFGLLEDGFIDTTTTGTSGRYKGTFRVKTGYGDPDRVTPVQFLVSLMGWDTDTGGAGASMYAVTISGYNDGSDKARISATKLHGPAWGSSETDNADLVSAHFGSSDTGSTSATMSSELTVTLAFGSGMAGAKARILPLTQRFPASGALPN